MVLRHAVGPRDDGDEEEAGTRWWPFAWLLAGPELASIRKPVRAATRADGGLALWWALL